MAEATGAPGTKAPPWDAFPPGVHCGIFHLELGGPSGRKILQGLARIPWSADPERPGETTRCVSPVQGLLIRQDCTTCGDCGCIHGLHFIVTDALWAQHGNGDGWLCLLCFEARMGRPIVLGDLKAGPGMNLLAFRIAGVDLADGPLDPRVPRWRSGGRVRPGPPGG